MSFLTLLHPCCLCQNVPPQTPLAPVPRFPSFLAQAGETAAVCEAPECCWQVFLRGLTLPRKTLPRSAAGHASRRLVARDAKLIHFVPSFALLSPGSCLLGCWLTDGFALSRCCQPFPRKDTPIPTPHPPPAPIFGGNLPGSWLGAVQHIWGQRRGCGVWVVVLPCSPVWPGVPGGAELQGVAAAGRCPAGARGAGIGSVHPPSPFLRLPEPPAVAAGAVCSAWLS